MFRNNVVNSLVQEEYEMINDLTDNERLLAELMSEISEKCYCAEWLVNTEYVLWDAVISGSRKFGQDMITNEEVEELRRLSNLTQTWIVFDGDEEETAVPLLEWQARFEQEIASDPGKLKW